MDKRKNTVQYCPHKKNSLTNNFVKLGKIILRKNENPDLRSGDRPTRHLPRKFKRSIRLILLIMVSLANPAKRKGLYSRWFFVSFCDYNESSLIINSDACISYFYYALPTGCIIQRQEVYHVSILPNRALLLYRLGKLLYAERWFNGCRAKLALLVFQLSF